MSSPRFLRLAPVFLLSFVAANSYAGSSAVRDDGSPISVTAVAGDVDVTMAGDAVTLAPKDTVLLPARIVTSHDGNVGLTQAGTNINVANDTDVEIPAEAVDGNLIARLVQHRGNVFYDVAPRDLGKLRVETPLLVAVIKGTQFNVAVDQDSTTISLFEGRLEIRTPDNSDVVQLNAGEIAIRSRFDGEIRVVGMDDERVAARPAAAADAAVRTAPADVVARTAPADDLAVRGAVDSSVALKPAIEVAGVDLGGAGRVALVLDSGVDLGRTGVDVGLDAGVDLGGAEVDVGLDAGLDVAGSSVDVGLDTGVDLGGGTVDLGLDTGVDLGGGTVDLGLDTGVDLGGGTVELGLDTAVDLGGGTVDLSLDTGVDLGETVDLGVDAGLDLGGVDTSIDAGIALDTGTLDLGLDLGGVLDVGLDVDLGGGTIDLGLGQSGTTAPAPAPEPRGGLDGLLRALL